MSNIYIYGVNVILKRYIVIVCVIALT